MGHAMGILFGRSKKAGKEKEVIELDNELIELDIEVENGAVSEDSSIEEVYLSVPPDVVELDASAQPSSSSIVSETGKKFNSLVITDEVDVSDVSAYRNLFETVERQRTPRLKQLDLDIEILERRRSFHQSLRPKKKPVEVRCLIFSTSITFQQG